MVFIWWTKCISSSFSIKFRQEWHIDRANYKLPTQRETKKQILKKSGINLQGKRKYQLYSSYVEAVLSSNFCLFRNQETRWRTFWPNNFWLKGGLKTEWLNGKLHANIAYFNIHQQNVLTDDPEDNAELKRGRSEPKISGDRNWCNGKNSSNWRINTGYSFIDTTLKKMVQSSERNTPKHSFNLWSRYDVEEGSIEKLWNRFRGELCGRKNCVWLDRSLVVPAYTVVDAALYYKLKAMQISLNINNVFNKKYWLGAFNYTRLFLTHHEI